MPPSRTGRKRFFHEINENTQDISPQPSDVTMDDMAPILNALPDSAPEEGEVAEMRDALLSEGTMRRSSELSTTSTLVGTENELGAVSSNNDKSSSTLDRAATSSPPNYWNPSRSSPAYAPPSPYVRPASDFGSSPSSHDEMADPEGSHSEAEQLPPFCNYINYCHHIPQTVTPLEKLSPARISEVFARFEGADPSYYHNFITAYLSETTFTAKVWINFDPSRPFKYSSQRNYQGFYTDRRAEDTGILHIPCSTRRYLQGLDHKIFRFQHIRLNVCTPFRTLATLNFDFEIKDSLEGFKFVLSGGFPDNDMVAGFQFLETFVQRQVGQIRAWVEEQDVQGLAMADLNAIALSFRKERELGDGERTGWMTEPMKHGGDWCEPEAEPEVVVQDEVWDGYVPLTAEGIAW